MAKIRFAKRFVLTDLDAFLRYLMNTEEQVTQAKHILELLQKKKEIPDKDWKVFVIHSVGLYTKVMKRLRDLGLVEKRNGYFSLSREFIYSLKKLIGYWEDYTSKL